MSPLLTMRRNVPAPNRPRRVGHAPNCPDAELAAPTRPISEFSVLFCFDWRCRSCCTSRCWRCCVSSWTCRTWSCSCCRRSSPSSSTPTPRSTAGSSSPSCTGYSPWRDPSRYTWRDYQSSDPVARSSGACALLLCDWWPESEL